MSVGRRGSYSKVADFMGLLNLNDTTKTKLAILALLYYEEFVKSSVVGSFVCKP